MTKRYFLLAGLALMSACKKTPDPGTGPAAAPVATVAPPAGKRWTDVVSLTSEGGYLMGNPNATVKLIEYGSRTCPICRVFEEEGWPKIKAGPVAQGKMSYEFRDFPVHGALDIGPALVGRCVNPDQYFPMLEAMFAAQADLLKNEQQVAQSVPGNATPPQVANAYADGLGYVDFVKQRGVPEAKVRACLNDEKAIEALAQRAGDATSKYGVNGTPTFVLNGTTLQGVTGWEALQPMLRNAGAM